MTIERRSNLPAGMNPRFSVFLSPAAADYAWAELLIREICDKHDVTFFEPHVTLCSGPFTGLPPLREVVAGAVDGLSPISLRIRGVGWSEEYFKTLFIDFEENPQLSALQEKIRAGCGDSSYEFRPHLSLLYAEMPLAAKEALARRTHLDRNELRFDSVKIVVPRNAELGWRDTGQWQTLFRKELGGETPPRAVLFDFGGVLAEEGFRAGLRAMAASQGLDPGEVHRLGIEAVYDSGYVLGRGSEADFWEMMRQRAGIRGEDAALTAEILARFVLRPRMLAAVRELRRHGYITAILSDQTDWLDRLDRRDRFFCEFDRVFNSYRMGKGKRDAELFTEVASVLGVRPEEAIFVDDMAGNVERAAAQGMRTILGGDEELLLRELARLCGVGMT